MAARPKSPPTAERVRELLRYEPDTGHFYWLADVGLARVGARAGYVKQAANDGYVYIGIDRGQYVAHRLAWLYVHGDWPSMGLDHINGNRTDNRIDNLRLATVAQNGWNRKAQRSSTSGFKGVTFHRKSGRWQAAIRYQGGPRHLGLFDTAEQAHAAYVDAANRLFGEFARAA